MNILRRQFVFCMVFAILVATICYPVNSVHASSQLGIKNVAVTKLIDAPTTKETLFVITTGEDTYHIIVDANITTVGSETLIDLIATLYNPLNESITASARIPDTLNDAPFHSGPVDAFRIHLDSPTVNALRIGLPIVIFVALFLEVVFIAAMIVIAPVLVALKLLLDDGFFIWASLPWVLLTLLQDANPVSGIDLYFPLSPWSVLRNLIFNYEIYYIRTNLRWWKISEIDVYIYVWIWRVELFDYYIAEPVPPTPTPQPTPPVARFVWTPNQPVANENVTFDGSPSYAPSGYITTYQWSFGDSSPLGTGISLTHSYVNQGNYDVTLIVTDNNSLTNTTTHTISVQVQPPPEIPRLGIVPDYLKVDVVVGQSATAEFYVGETLNQTDLLGVNFAATDFSKTFDSQTIASGNVAFDKNGITVPKGTWTNITVTYHAPPDSSEGWYSGNMTVTCANVNDSKTVFVDLIVLQPHGPKADFTVNPQTANVGQLVTFDATASQSGWNGTNQMPITKYSWDFGDGNKTDTTTPIIYHAFSSSGIYYPTLTVNASGATPETDSITKRVLIISTPVGGYSVSLASFKGYNTALPSSFYFTIVTMLAVVLTAIRRKKRQS